MRYATIVADPPWAQGSTGLDHGGGFRERGPFRPIPMPYREMALADIVALPVASLTAADAHLYLWTTQRFLRDSFTVVDAWGFTVSATLVWCKEPNGLALGGTFASSVEFCHFARRGNLPAKTAVDRRWFTWPRRKGPPVARGQRRPYQGTKPEAFLDLVESVSPGPYLEMFARRARFGWDYWGDESLGTAQLPERKPA